VVAIEPSAGMREQFERVLPDVRVLEGTGESIPLPDSTADTLVCAQAWHWVDPERAVRLLVTACVRLFVRCETGELGPPYAR
jgi:ubiquinone/menaquinone biosynthesis C-methylase UbiE